MALTRQVLTTLDGKGVSAMAPEVIAFKHPDENIVSGSLLTVETNEFAVLKSRGAVLAVYETGQYPITTPDKPILGSFVQGFFGGASPWLYEVIYVSRSKLLAKTTGIATSREMAGLEYQVDFYIHVDSTDDALALVTHMPFRGHTIRVAELVDYAGPVVEQAVNQIIQVTPLDMVNERIHDIAELVKEHLSSFLKIYGLHLNDLKVLIHPRDECQTARNRDPQSASKKDPSIMAGWACPGSEQEGPARPRSAFQRRWRSGRVGGACLPTWASRGWGLGRGCGRARRDQARFLKRQLSLPVSMMSQ